VITIMRTLLSLSLGAALAMATSVAGAQDLGGTSTPAPAAGGGGGESITSTAGPTDHSLVIGRLGLAYFGSTGMPVLSGGNTGVPYNGVDGLGEQGLNLVGPASTFMVNVNGRAQTFTAQGTSNLRLHTVGARYWLNGGLALEGGLSIGFSAGSRSGTTTSGGGSFSGSEDNPNGFGIGFVFGVPIMLSESKHLSIHLDPTLSLSYASSSIDRSNTVTDSSSSVFFGVGANMTAEIQFGFIGIPQLAIQARMGLMLNYRYASTTRVDRTSASSATDTASASAFGIATTVGPNYSLSDIIGGSISAVYYFGNAPQR